MIVLLAALVGIVALANRSAGLSPDFLTEFVLYGLWAADLTILLGLTFVLARNVIKLIVERRRALPFARFRGKLVAVLLGMTLIPAVLVLLVGQRADPQQRRSLVQRAGRGGADVRRSDCERLLPRSADARHRRSAAAGRQSWPAPRSTARTSRPSAIASCPRSTQGRVKMVEVYRVTPGTQPRGGACRMSTSPRPTCRAATRARSPIAWRRTRRRARSSRPTPEQLPTPASSFAPSAVVRRAAIAGARRRRHCQRFPDRRARVASARRIQDAYEDYTQLRVLRQPLAGVYLSFFLMMTLMILVGATWMGLYLAKRITEPVQRLATAAREIEAGHLDYRVDRGTVSDDEFGSLVEAFNSMASEVGKSRRRLERSTVDLERKHLEVEGRRRYIETILERIATGVVSIDAVGKNQHAQQRGDAAARA